MKLNLDNRAPEEVETGCLVIGVTGGGDLTPAAKAADEASGGMIRELLDSGDIQTGIGKISFVHKMPGLAAGRLLAIGFGEQEKLDLPRFDRACLAAGKALRDHALTACHVCVHELDANQLAIGQPADEFGGPGQSVGCHGRWRIVDGPSGIGEE